jgi:ribosomal protein S18 acetylase RimI-like enzyme
VTDPLDNVVWHALSTRQAALGKRHGSAARFDGAVSVFSAIADVDDPACWQDLDVLLGGRPGVLFAPDVVVPDGWTTNMVLPCLQMVATDVHPRAAEVPVVELGAQDVPDMLALVALTKPGPVGERTIEMGRYVGVREEGELVAMAGERFSFDGYTEVSLVCTSPKVRGRGLGRIVVDEVVANIHARGDQALLHVLTDNAPAIALYEAMGFTTRITSNAVGVRRETD